MITKAQYLYLIKAREGIKRYEPMRTYKDLSWTDMKGNSLNKGVCDRLAYNLRYIQSTEYSLTMQIFTINKAGEAAVDEYETAQDPEKKLAKVLEQGAFIYNQGPGGKPCNRPYQGKMSRRGGYGYYTHNDKITNTSWRIIFVRDEDTGEDWGWSWRNNKTSEYGAEYHKTLASCLDALDHYLASRAWNDTYFWHCTE